MHKRYKKKREFSKVIFLFVCVFTVIIAAFSCVLMWRTSDTSALAFLIPSVFAETATGTAFYYHKAKEENKIKLKQKYNITEECTDDEKY